MEYGSYSSQMYGLPTSIYPEIDSPAQIHKEKKKKLRSHDSYCYGLGKSQLPKRRKYLENKTNETVILRLIERALALRPLGYIQPNLQRGDGQMEGTGDIPQNVPWSGTGSLAQTNSLCKTYQIM